MNIGTFNQALLGKWLALWDGRYTL